MSLNYIEYPPKDNGEYLVIIAHGVGSNKEDMAPIGKAINQTYPTAHCVVVDGFDAFDSGFGGRQWFSIKNVTEENRTKRITSALPQFVDMIKALQKQLGFSEKQTVLVGFSQGTIMSLETVKAHDGIVAKVLGFSGRYAQLPNEAPKETAIHLFHGEADPVISIQFATQAFERLKSLGAKVSLDTEKAVNHSISQYLFNCAIKRFSEK
ncbi:esterase [Spirochaeta cellobiosiphila]|uniref:esterase n=1 Tax=Spirochaeta cellobiosiphila TaxID=504483 RepID=UPI000427ADF0|nr:esterase [Spirochaeta cellobiosiphila]